MAKEARAACASKEPEDYQEREKRLDPTAYKDHLRAQVKCMRSHSLGIETTADGWGFTDVRDMDSPWLQKCTRLAFGD